MHIYIYMYKYIYIYIQLPSASPPPCPNLDWWFCIALLAVELRGHLLVLGMVLWQNQISICSLALLKSRTECCPNFDIHFLVAEALGECCPNFGTLALFKRRENAAQILIFILWLGHSLEHPKVAQITSKSTQNRPKIMKSWYLGWLWAPLGSPWRPLGHHLGAGYQKPSKK